MQTRVIEGYRLSPQQRRLWHMENEGVAFRARCAIKLEGILDDAALKRAAENLVRRHEMLRARFHGGTVMKTPIQIISQENSLNWESVDLRATDQSEQQQRIEQIYYSGFATLPDYDSGPVMTLTLLKLADDSAVLIIDVPALCADGWAMAELAKQIIEEYIRPRPAPEFEEEFQYFQFAEWQNEMLELDDEDARRGIEYWSRMALPDSSVVLPCESRVKGTGRFAPEIVAGHLDKGCAKRIRDMAAEYRVSARDVLAACWTALIRRLSGQNEIVIHNMTDERFEEELRGRIGLYAKSLPILLRTEEKELFKSLLLKWSEATVEASRFSEYYNCQRKDAKSDSPGSYPISFEYWDGFESHAEAGFAYSVMRHYSCVDWFKVKLSCLDLGEEIRFEIHFDPNVYGREIAELTARRFEMLIGHAISEPSIPINRLKIIGEIERHRLQLELNDTDRVYLKQGTIHEQFEQQAERTPDRVALVFEDSAMTYGELNRRANQLAHYLQSIGTRPDHLVAIYLDRSHDMLVGALGIMKAGGAYVPLDPAYPAKRLSMILEDTNPCAVLTSEHLAARLDNSTAKVVCLDADRETLSRLQDHNPVRSAGPENLVYVIFTSGSTGRPKGVAVEHRHLLNYAQGVWERLDLPDETSFATVSTFAADLGNTAIFLPLIAGGCLHIISFDRGTTPSAFADYFSERSIDCLKIVPSHFAALLASPEPCKVMPRKRLILGGEASRSDWVEEIRGLSSSCAIFNHYGPTETTVGAFTFAANKLEISEGYPTLLLGQPLPNTRGYVLDREMEPLPIGAVGELCIGGAGVARGYLNMPDLTAEKFIPDQFSLRQGARLYTTGDLVRYLTDGNAEFLGRSDDQVKFHGYRVELNEIRTALNRHPLIKDSLVAVANDSNNSDVIIAYYVAKQEIEVSRIREFLRESIVETTIPNIYVHLNKLPLTINGKIDKAALPGIEEAKKRLNRIHTPPNTYVEELVAGIWTEVLGLERIGVEENFFDLGGHSLLATQVVSRVRRVLNLDIPLRLLFESPTISSFARSLEQLRKAGRVWQAPPIRPVSRDQMLPLSYAQQRLWFMQQLDPQSAAYNITNSLRVRGALNLAAVSRSLQEIARRHEVLRTRFEVREGMPVQVIEEAREVEIGEWDVSESEPRQREERAREIARQEGGRAMDLGAGPLWRVGVVKMGEEDHVLMMSMHHVVSDGWLMGVMIREFTALYEGYRQGREEKLEEMEIQYADYAVWQREWLRGEVLEEEVGYWRKQLGGMRVEAMGTDRVRPVVASQKGGKVGIRIGEEMSKGIKEMSRREGVTIFMLLLAAFKIVLCRQTGIEDIPIGTPIANRNMLETEGLIGFFVNQLVLRTDLSGNPSLREILERVRTIALDAFAHQNLPFEKLVEELAPQRELDHPPLFSVDFVLQNAPQEVLKIGGLSFTGFSVDYAVAKFDLTLAFLESKAGIDGIAVYAEDLYDRLTIERMMGHLLEVLKAMLADVKQRIGDVGLLTEVERQQMLVDWSGARRDWGELYAHRVFEQQVERSPDAVAVMSETGYLSYAALNERANRLAHHLKELGVCNEARLALCMERSLEMIVALLAVLKAGAAYVPIATDYPPERQAYMLDNAQVSVLLTKSTIRLELPVTRVHRVEVDSEWEKITGARPATNPDLAVRADSLAYVIYTSGSTGWPKGVMLTHKGLINYLNWARETYRIDECSGSVVHSPISFDLTITGLFLPLLCGSVVKLVEDADAVQALVAAIGLCDGHSLMKLTPAQLDMIRSEVDGERVSKLARILVIGGEALNWSQLEYWRRAARGTRLINEYGPTETVVGCCVYEALCDGEFIGPVPIGRPVANTRAYVMDKWRQLAPAGAIGELNIGGAGLARGYCNDAGITAEKFVPDALSGETGARMYRTGDLARWLPEGELQYLGRVDEQVKLRGYRIELGEVESALAENPWVQQCAVCLREDKPGDQRLVGYIVPLGEVSPTSAQLRAYLQARLPDYIIPSVFEELIELPLTPNGKVNKKALPAPTSAEQTSVESDSPLTPIEEIVADIFAKVLRLERVDPGQNFFSLGGHSLLATQVVSQIRDLLKVELPLRVIFKSPTATEVAKAVEQKRSAGSGQAQPPLRPVSRDEVLPLSFAQQRLWFLDKLMPGSSVHNVPTAIGLSGPLSIPALESALTECVRRHETLRTCFGEEDGRPIQKINDPWPVTLPLVQPEPYARAGTSGASRNAGERSGSTTI